MKLLIVDDHIMVRQALAALLERDSVDTRVVHAADSAEAFQSLLAHQDLDAVFLDLNLPGVSGMAVLRELGRLRPALPVIVLSAVDDPAKVRQAFAAGALGYVPKAASASTLLAALRLVMSGEMFVPALALDPPTPFRPRRAPRQQHLSAGGLTLRQAEVLQRMAEGLSNKGIANRMSLSEKTVKAHVTAVFRALGVGGRREAVTAARAAGFI